MVSRFLKRCFLIRAAKAIFHDVFRKLPQVFRDFRLQSTSQKLFSEPSQIQPSQKCFGTYREWHKNLPTKARVLCPKLWRSCQEAQELHTWSGDFWKVVLWSTTNAPIHEMFRNLPRSVQEPSQKCLGTFRPGFRVFPISVQGVSRIPATGAKVLKTEGERNAVWEGLELLITRP